METSRKFLYLCLMVENNPRAVAVLKKEILDNDSWEFQRVNSSVRFSFQGRIYNGKVDSIYLSDSNLDCMKIQILSECIARSDIKNLITKIIKSGWRRVDDHMYYDELPIERVMEKVDQMIEKHNK